MYPIAQADRQSCSWRTSTLTCLSLALSVGLATIPLAGALAQVTPGGIATRVNGSVFGHCKAGSCAINGGAKAGRNLFHRLANFDTRRGITDVKIDSRGQENIILGIAGSQGIFLNKPLVLTSPANLFLLSPRGIWVGAGAKFSNISNLLLSTSSSLKLGRDTYQLFSSTREDVLGFRDSPSIQWGELANPRTTLAELDLSGHGSITFDGGRIAVDRNLLIHANQGFIRASGQAETTLKAGAVVQLAAAEVELKNTSITARQGSTLGSIQITAFTDQLNVTGSSLLGRNLRMQGPDIEINNSRLYAPNGGIEIRAIRSDEQESGLSILRSILDVSHDHQFTEPREMNLKTSPHIALSSEGSINLSQTMLNTAVTPAAERHPSDPSGTSPAEPRNERSGVIFIRARNAVAIDGSAIVADGQNGRAGQIVVAVDGHDDKGGIRISHSRFSASHGMGGGKLVLDSTSGIRIESSELAAVNDRFPLINGRSFGLLEDGIEEKERPFAFEGGQISISSSSAKTGIIIDRSKILALQSTDGGGLANDEFHYIWGQSMGFFDNKPAFTLGYVPLFTGGQILINSAAGIHIGNNSLIDASSGTVQTGVKDSTAGNVAIANLGERAIVISDSTIASASGSPGGPASLDQLSGSIKIINHGEITMNNATLNVFIDTTQSKHLQGFPSITVGSVRDALYFAGINTFDVTWKSGDDEYFSLASFFSKKPLFFDPGIVKLLPLDLATPIEGPPENPKDIVSNLDNLNQLFQAQALASLRSTSGVSTDELSLAFATSIPVLPMSLLASDSLVRGIQENVAVTNNLDPDSVSSAFLDAQKSNLESTLQALGLSAERAKVRNIAELQGRLAQASRVASSARPPAAAVPPPASVVPSGPYVPAILHLQRDDQTAHTTRITAFLLNSSGPTISRSIELPRTEFDRWIRGFQRQLSRRAPPPSKPERDPGQWLSQALLEPLLPELRTRGITALLLEADRGLQAIPYAALPLEGRPLGDAIALTITPSLGLIELNPDRLTQRNREGQMLLAGASSFANGLDPLPMVVQELKELASEHPATLLLDAAFTPAALLDQALAPGVRQLHVATHANFLPGQGGNGVLYTASSSLSLADLGRALRSRDSSNPLDLISLSGCVTTLGDEQSELGFVGMALQANARSGLGTLWEVDDAATAAFFIQFYRQLKQGLPKDQALQTTQRAFLRQEVRLEGDRLVGPDPAAPGGRSTLVRGLTREQQTLFAQGLSHPYYWAGMVLSGSPW